MAAEIAGTYIYFGPYLSVSCSLSVNFEVDNVLSDNVLSLSVENLKGDGVLSGKD